MKKIALVYEITNNPYFDTNSNQYSNRIAEFVYPSEINSICKAISALGYHYDMVDGAAGLLKVIESRQHFDLIFNKSIGFRGLERKIAVPAICQQYNLPRVGSGAYAMTLARHKYHTNRLLHGIGFNVPFAYLYTENKSLPIIPSFPVIVKPNEESDALGISEKSICYSMDEVYDIIVDLRVDFQQPLIIEEYIPGEEWKVAVIGNGVGTRACGCVNSLKNQKLMTDTLQTRSDILNNTLSYLPVDNNILKSEALFFAEQTHKILGLSDYSRCDFRIGKDNKLYCMEVSTHPEISPNSSFIESAKLTYNDYNTIVNKIIESAIERN